jgi:Cu-Zn family superoxide dismutase
MIKQAMVGTALLFTLAGCGSDDDGGGEEAGPTASATLAPTTGNEATGNAKFTQQNGLVSASLEISGAPAGTHGVHLHQVGACGNDAMDAAGHWDGNAEGDPADHALPDDGGHLGDLGNITIGADGKGTLTISNDAWTLGDGGDGDVVGHAVIFHAMTDDGTMPSSGPRAACGVIELD